MLLGLWKVRKILLNGEGKRFERYLIHCMEVQERRIRSADKPSVSQTVKILDFYGFNAKEMLCAQCLTIFINAMRINDKYYPHQVYISYLINSKYLLY